MEPAPPPPRPPAERIKWTTLHSWVKVFRAQVRLRQVNHPADLTRVVQAGDYSIVGTSHSYNGIQLVDRTLAVHFGKSDPRRTSALHAITYDDATGEVELIVDEGLMARRPIGFSDTELLLTSALEPGWHALELRVKPTGESRLEVYLTGERVGNTIEGDNVRH